MFHFRLFVPICCSYTFVKYIHEGSFYLKLIFVHENTWMPAAWLSGEHTNLIPYNYISSISFAIFSVFPSFSLVCRIFTITLYGRLYSRPLYRGFVRFRANLFAIQWLETFTLVLEVFLLLLTQTSRHGGFSECRSGSFSLGSNLMEKLRIWSKKPRVIAWKLAIWFCNYFIPRPPVGGKGLAVMVMMVAKLCLFSFSLFTFQREEETQAIKEKVLSQRP